MLRIRFLREEQYEHRGRKSGPVYAAGDVVLFRDQVARRWLRIPGAAELAGDDVVSAKGAGAAAPARRRKRRRTKAASA